MPQDGSVYSIGAAGIQFHSLTAQLCVAKLVILVTWNSPPSAVHLLLEAFYL